MLARGRQVRQSRLLFYAKMAEKALQTYERDGWGEFPTHINLDRREVRRQSSPAFRHPCMAYESVPQMRMRRTEPYKHVGLCGPHTAVDQPPV